MPLVSIIVATYRREKELCRALDSIKNLNYTNYEIVLVDDNDDEMWNRKVEDIVNEFISDNKEISFTYAANHPNLGSAKTRNVGIDLAKGEYICFLDDDDVYLPNRIINQLNLMIKTDADYSITDLALYNEDDKLIEIRERDYIEETTPQKLFEYHLMYHMTGTDSLMFKKEYLIDIGAFDPIDIGDEFYLMSKAILNEGKFVYAPFCDLKAYIHQAGGGLSSGINKIDGENQLFEYKKKYFNKLSTKQIYQIKVRHYFVIAYAQLKEKKYIECIFNLVIAFFNSPKESIALYKRHRRN